jgi:hypothetical protein
MLYWLDRLLCRECWTYEMTYTNGCGGSTNSGWMWYGVAKEVLNTYYYDSRFKDLTLIYQHQKFFSSKFKEIWR